MIPRRILVPVTLARESAEVAAEAATLAAAVHAELLLLGVAPDGAGEQRALDELVAQRLDELAGTLPPAAGARILLARGAVAPALVATARRRAADLVVVPLRREREPDRYLLRHTDVPLLLVPAGPPRTPPGAGGSGPST